MQRAEINKAIGRISLQRKFHCNCDTMDKTDLNGRALRPPAIKSIATTGRAESNFLA